MTMPGRKYQAGSSSYRYGFNGKEKDNEVKGEGNQLDFGSRINDPRLGRWLSVDPLTRKYADISPYAAFGNSPTMIIDPNGEDIVYFNSSGMEYNRIVSKTQFETWVDVKKQVQVIHFIPEFDAQGQLKPFVETRTVTSPVKVPMPDIITEKLSTKKGKDGQWIVEKGLADKKYQQYDYQIAASTFLFNEAKNNGTQFVTDGGMKIPTAITSKVSDVSPTSVKELMMQESHAGTDASMNGKEDIMQVNNGVSNFQDFKPYKTNYGLSKGTVPGPLLSLTAGLKDLMTKGFHGSPVQTDSKGNISSIVFQGWLLAGKSYNGGGVPNYQESLQHMEATKRTPTANDY